MIFLTTVLLVTWLNQLLIGLLNQSVIGEMVI